MTPLAMTMADRYPRQWGTGAEAVLLTIELTPELVAKLKASQTFSFVMDKEPRQPPPAFTEKLHAFLEEYESR